MAIIIQPKKKAVKGYCKAKDFKKQFDSLRKYAFDNKDYLVDVGE